MARSRTARNGILILGGGFAGAYVARLLGKRDSILEASAIPADLASDDVEISDALEEAAPGSR